MPIRLNHARAGVVLPKGREGQVGGENDRFQGGKRTLMPDLSADQGDFGRVLEGLLGSRKNPANTDTKEKFRFRCNCGRGHNPLI